MPCEFEPYGLIGDKWRHMGGEGSVFGCPAGPDEFDVHLPWGSPGRARDFANGQIVWSPNQGPNLLIAAYATNSTIVFEWGPTDPFNYDQWIVRWSVTGGIPVPPDAQEEVPLNAPGRTRTTGFFHTDLPDNIIGSDGNRVGVSFVVEGYDDDGNSRQGWTAPVCCRL